MKISLRKAFALSSALQTMIHSNQMTNVRGELFDMSKVPTTPSSITPSIDVEKLKLTLTCIIGRLSALHLERVKDFVDQKLEICDLIHHIRRGIHASNNIVDETSNTSIDDTMAKIADIDRKISILSGYQKPHTKHDPSSEELLMSELSSTTNSIINSIRTNNTSSLVISPIRVCPELHNQYHNQLQELKAIRAACTDWLAYANNRFQIELLPEHVLLVEQCHLSYIIK